MLDYQQIDELYHHGVIGMRWGHRKDRIKNFINRHRPNFSAKRNSSNVTTNDNVVSNRLHNKVNYRQATNEQLKRATERLRLENDYQTQVQRKLELNPKKQSFAKRAVNKVFGEMLTPALTTAGKDYLQNRFKQMLEGEKQISPQEKAASDAKYYDNLAKIARNKAYLKSITKKAVKTQSSKKRSLRLSSLSDTVYRDTTNKAIQNIIKKMKIK